MKSRFLSAFLCALVLCALLSVPALSAERRYVGLTILHTNDLHGHVFPFDYDKLGKTETDVGGIARTAALIRYLKSSSDNHVLVMEAGDVFTRGPIADLAGAPEFAILNAVPYDVMTLGNNEFNSAEGLVGQRNMFARIKQARFPVVCANVIDMATEKPIVPPYTVFEFDGCRVGVFGLTAARVAHYSQAKGLTIQDPLAAAREAVDDMQGKVDFIVGLTHVGYDTDLKIAAALPQIDVIIGGDSHTWLFEPTLVRHENTDLPEWSVKGTIVCQDGEWGRCLGKLDLKLRATETGRYRVMSYSGELVTVDASIQPAQDVEAILARYTKPFGRTVGELKAAVPFPQAADWVAECIRRCTDAEIAVQPKYAVENGLKPGRVTLLDIRRMLPYPDPLRSVRLTAQQLLDTVGQLDCALAGAEVQDGKLYVAGEPAGADQVYSAAVAEYYLKTVPALAACESTDLGITTREAVEKCVANSQHVE